jgi:farnesyl diphosphate synthase
MCGGQAIDLDSTGKTLDIVELENMHIHKTGALIRASVKLGALASESATEEQFKRLDHYAKCIGLAFQIHDDILDVEGETGTLGKTKGKDAAQNKPTYPGIIGLDAAREKADLLIQDALQQLDIFDLSADPLRGLAEYIVNRKH